MFARKKFLFTYLSIVLIFAIISIIHDTLLVVDTANPIIGTIVSVLALLFFLFNVIVIALFHYHDVKKVFFIMPIYVILSQTILFAGGMVLFLSSSFSLFLSKLVVISLVMSYIELLFGVYLFRKVYRS